MIQIRQKFEILCKPGILDTWTCLNNPWLKMIHWASSGGERNQDMDLLRLHPKSVAPWVATWWVQEWARKKKKKNCGVWRTFLVIKVSCLLRDSGINFGIKLSFHVCQDRFAHSMLFQEETHGVLAGRFLYNVGASSISWLTELHQHPSTIVTVGVINQLRYPPWV